MNKKIIAYIAILSFILATPALSLNASPGFNMTVFSPNNVSYDLNVYFNQVVKNSTTNEILDSYGIHVVGELTLVSKRMQLDYIGWGFIIDIKVSENSDGYVQESNYNASVPPVIVVKENTRLIYPTQLLMNLIQGGFGNTSIQDILKDVSMNQPYTKIYVYNPFYIEIPVSIGDSIPYGFWNVTADSGIIVNGKVTAEEQITVNSVSYDTYVVNVTKTDILDALREFMSENMTLPPGVNFNIGFYYDKGTGWLTKLNMIGGGEVSEDNVTQLIVLEGNMDLKNAGTVMIHNKSYLDRIFGLPSYTFLALDIFFIIAIIIIRIRRS